MPRTRKMRKGNPHLDERELSRLGRIGSTATSIGTDPLSYSKKNKKNYMRGSGKPHGK